MNTMNLPGFTAESALSKNSLSYKETCNLANESNNQVVLPQSRVICYCTGGRCYCGIEDDSRGMSYPI